MRLPIFFLFIEGLWMAAASKRRKRVPITQFEEYTIHDVLGEAPSFTTQAVSSDGCHTHSTTHEVDLPPPMKRARLKAATSSSFVEYVDHFEYVFEDLVQEEQGPKAPACTAKPQVKRKDTCLWTSH
ncbi:hypothetical protein B0H17DRAFT_1137672 [Mycena rosella]|uniref:Uncharacterized protein n=1 Tax=Mycena rosella TaxID=1033263 RepID=A0AAD7D897_MYCRO|nr:hypothetical protein B0H17DRAFT_1137672 [Mycena rosella]